MFTVALYVHNIAITVYVVYLVNIKVDELERKCKLVDIQFGEDDDIDVDCLTNNWYWRTLNLATK